MLTDGRTDDGVTGILIAHLGAFGSGELKILGFTSKIKVGSGYPKHRYFFIWPN